MNMQNVENLYKRVSHKPQWSGVVFQGSAETLPRDGVSVGSIFLRFYIRNDVLKMY